MVARAKEGQRNGGSIIESIQRFALRNPEALAAVPLVAINGLVFLAWRVNPGSTFMMRNFLNSPSNARRSLPMLLSTFSHVSLPHLAFNMYALWSFGTLMVSYMGPENFMATYITAGAVSSFGSVAFSHLSSRPPIPSLGASGAILGIVSSVACANPDLRFSIILLPFTAMPALYMVAGIATLDLTGLILGWRFFDHAAHIAGIGFGAWLIQLQGYKFVRSYQHRVRDAWRALRK